MCIRDRLCIESLDINKHSNKQNYKHKCMWLWEIFVVNHLISTSTSLDINKNCSNNDGDKETGCDQLAKARTDSHNLGKGVLFVFVFVFVFVFTQSEIREVWEGSILIIPELYYLFPIFDLGSKSVYIFCKSLLILPTLNHPTVHNIPPSGEAKHLRIWQDGYVLGQSVRYFQFLKSLDDFQN